MLYLTSYVQKPTTAPSVSNSETPGTYEIGHRRVNLSGDSSETVILGGASLPTTVSFQGYQDPGNLLRDELVIRDSTGGPWYRVPQGLINGLSATIEAIGPWVTLQPSELADGQQTTALTSLNFGEFTAASDPTKSFFVLNDSTQTVTSLYIGIPTYVGGPSDLLSDRVLFTIEGTYGKTGVGLPDTTYNGSLVYGVGAFNVLPVLMPTGGVIRASLRLQNFPVNGSDLGAIEAELLLQPNRGGASLPSYANWLDGAIQVKPGYSREVVADGSTVTSVTIRPYVIRVAGAVFESSLEISLPLTTAGKYRMSIDSNGTPNVRVFDQALTEGSVDVAEFDWSNGDVTGYRLLTGFHSATAYLEPSTVLEVGRAVSIDSLGMLENSNSRVVGIALDTEGNYCYVGYTRALLADTVSAGDALLPDATGSWQLGDGPVVALSDGVPGDLVEVYYFPPKGQDGVGGGGSGGTGQIDLGYVASPTQGSVTNTGGLNATIPAATTTNAGLFLPAEKSKLAAIPVEGSPGPQGPQGLKGDTGDAGPQGLKGDTGDAGPQGLKGDTGPQGPQGLKGDTGLTGPQGLKGDTGLTGPQGLKGDTGDTGPQGLKGDTGPTGSQGPKGDTGLTGPQGLKGDAGLTGPQGLKGDTGLTGPQGPKGDKGDTGDVGPQGPQGIPGPGGSGEGGVNSTNLGYTASTTQGIVTSDTGTNAVIPAATSTNAGLFLSAEKSKLAAIPTQGVVGPQGPKGDTGDTGPQGPQGPQGPKGDTGDIGLTGPQGPQGLKGDTGLTGPQGLKGDTGLTGPQGLKGDTGDTGPQGLKGDTGLTGPQGLKGDTGLTGPQGLKGDAGLTGPQGPKGDAGDIGLTGPQGLKGDIGLTGPQGLKGDTGDAGPQGLKGNTGLTGPQGLKGDTGLTGPQGLKGDTGDTGPQGPQGLKGDTGDTGPQGPQGLKGDTGDTGPQGLTGPMGPSGSTSQVTLSLTLTNGWINFGNGFAGASVSRVGKIVLVEGLVALGNTTPGVSITTLPPGFRPAATLLFSAQCAGGTVRLDVDNMGNLKYAGDGTAGANASAYLSLIMTFIAA